MLRWTALGGMNVSQRLPHQQPASTPPVFSSQKVSTCREERHKLSFLSPPTAISSRWRWNSVFRNPSNTCQNETGHLVPLPGEHSISRTCKYRGTCKENVSSTFLTQGKVGWTTSLCALHIAVLLPLPAPPCRHQAAGGAVTGKYACCNSLMRVLDSLQESQSQTTSHLLLSQILASVCACTP